MRASESMSQNSQSQNARSRMQQGNADQQAAHWNNTERRILLADSYIGAPRRLCRQPDLCLPHRWNTSVDELSKLVYGQKLQVEIETARFLNANPAYLVCKLFHQLFPIFAFAAIVLGIVWQRQDHGTSRQNSNYKIASRCHWN